MNTIKLNTIGTPKANAGGGGGGNTPSTSKPALAVNDVTFYDYDGTILYAYTKDEFLKLKEMPPLPTQEGLICQEWNYEYVDARDYVGKYGVLDVGATYITADGKSRFYIDIPYGGMLISWWFGVSGKVVIDWGDGQQSTFTGFRSPENHTYEKKGKYIVEVDASNGTFTLGATDAGCGIIGRNQRDQSSVLYKAELGINTTLGASASYTGGMYNCSYLETINLPSHINFIANFAFSNCFNLKGLVIPKNVEECAARAFENNKELSALVLPSKVKIMGSYSAKKAKRVILPEGVASSSSSSSSVSIVAPQADFFCGPDIQKIKLSNNESLKNIVFSTTGKSLPSSMFNKCILLESVSLEEGLTNIPTSTFYDCWSLRFLKIPKSVAEISNQAFYNCYSLQWVDFSEHESVPTLSGSSAFSSVSSTCKFIVPDNLYEEWMSATNWSTHSYKIIKKSEWDAQNA